MKKLLRIAVVLGLALCLSVSAFAASSQGASVVGAVDKETGEKVDVTVSSTDTVPSTADAAEAIAAAAPGGESIPAADLTVAWKGDVSVDNLTGPVTITFEVPGATANQKVYVLHYENGGWVVVGEGTGSTVEATFNSLSPVAIVVETPQTTPTNPETPYIPGVGMESPTTGEGPALMVAAAIVLLAGVVAVVAMKKREEV